MEKNSMTSERNKVFLRACVWKREISIKCSTNGKKEHIQMANKHIKKMFNIISHYGIAN